MLLSAEQIVKTYGTRTLLDCACFYLEEGDRIGIVGANGAGKSTLLRILAGVEEPESGTVTRAPGMRLEYLAQNPAFEPGAGVLEQVLLGLSGQGRTLAEFEAKTILTKLGITQFERPVELLSGGERRRVALAAALAHPCDVLILDEPTNHLDSEMVRCLESYLLKFTGALVMVTHDRYFLERLVRRTAEVDAGKLYFYEGGYGAYLEGKARREEMDQASERKRQSILRREYQWVMQGPKARGTKSRERLERYEALRDQPGLRERQELSLSAVSSRLGKKTVELKGACKSFDGRMILKPFDCILLRDDRIGIVGANGTGKSTLLHLIAGDILPDSGSVVIGDTVRIGYFRQETPHMDGTARVIDYVKEIGNRIETSEGMLTAGQLLEKFLFSKEAQWAPVSKLSGGEQRRLYLLAVLAAAPNVLLLDEPTNDLDIQTLTILEDYLETFPGAVISVSHDRYFLDKMARRIFAVEDGGQVTGYAGGYTAYLEARQDKREQVQRPAEHKPKERPIAKTKLSYQEQREYDGIDGQIAALEQQIAENHRQQESKASDYMALEQLQEALAELEAQLEERMERWVYLNELAEQISKQ